MPSAPNKFSRKVLIRRCRSEFPEPIAASCLYGSWTQTQDTNYACLPFTTLRPGPANTSYLARYNFVVNVFGPCNPKREG